MRALVNTIAAGAVFGAVALVLAACAGPQSAAVRHPEEVRESPLCSSCHEKDARSAFDHASGWAGNHQDAARQSARTCELCHRPSFCADCHGAKEELKPSEKRGDRPGVAMPHRGDYLTRHKIDGRIDPVSCFGCHGRKNDWRCAQCHR
jgi:hypothetical protein